MSAHDKDHHFDAATGKTTTGHEWDGIRELNTPLPKWWLYLFYVTIVWAFGYYAVYPAWPYLTGDGWKATQGALSYSQRGKVAEAVAENEARLAPYTEAILANSFEQILADPELTEVAFAGGAVAFKDNCAGCHGTGAQGFTGFPNLNDDDWIWGGSIEQIHTTITHGIRWEANDETRYSAMPSFGRDELLKKDEIRDVTEYVLKLAGADHRADRAARGAETFEVQCSGCHNVDGTGDREQGAPDLTDAIWLFGGDRKAIYETIYYARNAVMPAWNERLDAATIKKLAIYVHSLGGGETPTITDAR
ncbi:MAG: cytochrome-c oxidase, cbb3-type subunit III [Pseudomonadota bacterium]